MSMRTFTLAVLVPLTGLVEAAQGADKLPPLSAAHIACGEQYKPDPRSKDSLEKQCTDAANAFYSEEWQPQVAALLAGRPEGMEEIRPATTFELPDGSLVPGANLGAYAPTLFGASAVRIADISNDFVFKPIDRDTILVFGAPKFIMKTKEDTAYTIPSAQLSVYRRTKRGVPPRGWEVLGEFWSYATANRGPLPPPQALVPPAGAPPPAAAPPTPAKAR